MALLDSGVRFTHQILSHLSVIGERRDCVRGGTDCNTGPNLKPEDVIPHGTSAAAVICANPNQSDAYCGVTRIRLDSWRVITEPDKEQPGMLDTVAVLRGFENAARLRYLVISASIGDPGADDLSSVSLAADNAFDAGVATIAAAGNISLTDPPTFKVHSPANAHKPMRLVGPKQWRARKLVVDAPAAGKDQPPRGSVARVGKRAVDTHTRRHGYLLYDFRAR
jgi:serine protease AprX